MDTRTFVLGDVHGAYRAMMQCFGEADFDYRNDRLIFLGDISDGWSEVPECIEELKKINDLVLLKGNHDLWLIEWLEKGKKEDIWLYQGGLITVKAYEKQPHLKKNHLEFMKSAKPYYLDDQNRLFVHAGFTLSGPVEETGNPDHDYYWDRELYKKSFDQAILPERYPEIYIGHTPSHHISRYPIKNHNVWLMDQGAGWNGYLSIMDIETRDVYQSDNVQELYPHEKGRLGLLNKFG